MKNLGCRSYCVYLYVCVCVRVWPEASLVSGSPEHAGTAGQCVYDLSIWSLPGARSASLCSVCVCVFLKGKTLQAVTVPETLTNKLICVPLLPNSIYTQQPYTSPDFGAAFKHNVPFAPSAEGTEDSSSYFHPPSCTVFLSLPGTAIHTVCLSPPPTQRCRLQALCCVVSAWPRL